MKGRGKKKTDKRLEQKKDITRLVIIAILFSPVLLPLRAESVHELSIALIPILRPSICADPERVAKVNTIR
jgi:hypothetical protein